MKIFKIMGKKIKISDFEIVKNLRIKKNKSKKKINIHKNNFLMGKISKNKINNKSFLGVSIDSKTLKKGNLFIAIKGKNNDGHHFVKEALLKGAANCIISKNSPNFPKK